MTRDEYRSPDTPRNGIFPSCQCAGGCGGELHLAAKTAPRSAEYLFSSRFVATSKSGCIFFVTEQHKATLSDLHSELDRLKLQNKEQQWRLVLAGQFGQANFSDTELIQKFSNLSTQTDTALNDPEVVRPHVAQIFIASHSDFCEIKNGGGGKCQGRRQG